MQFELRLCNSSHLQEIAALQKEAFGCLERSEWLRENSREMLLACLNEPHVTVGAFAGGELAAFAVLYLGELTEENLGWSLGLAERELPLVANFKLVIVRPKYRGHALMRTLMAELEKTARARKICLLCTTVHPENMASKISIEKSGYAFLRSMTKYGGLSRSLYGKELEDGFLERAVKNSAGGNGNGL